MSAKGLLCLAALAGAGCRTRPFDPGDLAAPAPDPAAAADLGMPPADLAEPLADLAEPADLAAPPDSSMPTDLLGLADLLPQAGPQLALGWIHTLARMPDGTLTLWGDLYFGTDKEMPLLRPIPLPGWSGVASVAARGNYASWALYDDGRLEPIHGTSVRLSNVARMAPGFESDCAILRDGSVWCWGFVGVGVGVGVDGGAGPWPWTATPVEITGLGEVVDLSPGWHHLCAVSRAGGLACWGLNTDGELGDGTTLPHFEPTPVDGLSGVVQVSTGSSSTCARIEDGSVSCWGSNRFGQLGDGTFDNRSRPVTIFDGGVAQIALGHLFGCARLDSGQVRCWGNNETGALGDGTLQTRTAPTAVLDLDDAVELVAGGAHACARRRDGRLACWGWGEWGQLGDGAGVNRVRPVTVQF
jgi:Regulator of chromosome condensation (RCC1) repeat